MLEEPEFDTQSDNTGVPELDTQSDNTEVQALLIILRCRRLLIILRRIHRLVILGCVPSRGNLVLIGRLHVVVGWRDGRTRGYWQR